MVRRMAEGHEEAVGPVIGRKDIEAAAGRINGRVRTTPTVALEAGAWGVDARLFLKLESLQHTGSFKPRGALNRLLSNPLSPAGVVAASGGNHGAAVAYAAKELGTRAEVFVPELCPPAKLALIRRYGAEVTVGGQFYAEALEASLLRAEETGALGVHAYDQPEIVAGQGTLGREFAQQMPDLDTVLVAVGGGGLIGGIAAWFRGDARVVAVEPEGAPTLFRALEAGGPVDVEVGGVAADSLGARRLEEVSFCIAREHVDEAVLVPDAEIGAAQRALWRDLRLVTEPGGATALAPLLSGGYVPEVGERVGVVICGANTDPITLSEPVP
jgi:threonine dehydratase